MVLLATNLTGQILNDEYYRQYAEMPISVVDFFSVAEDDTTEVDNLLLSLGADMVNGRLDIVQPSNERLWCVKAEGRRQFGKSLKTFGDFLYSYSSRERQAYSMISRPGSTLFEFADTIRADVHQERYRLRAMVEYEMGDMPLSFGLSGTMTQMSTAKQRDIRNKNTLNNLSVAPHIGCFISKMMHIMLLYRFAQEREVVSLKQMGPSNVIGVMRSEGLWFGEMTPYAANGFEERRYLTRSNYFNALISRDWNALNASLSLFFSTIEQNVEVKAKEEEIGESETMLTGADFQFTYNAGTLKHLFALLFRRAPCDSYKPLQRQETNGNNTHYVKYGRVIRNTTRHTLLKAEYTLNGGAWHVGAAFSKGDFVATQYVHPAEYEQTLSSTILAAHGGYDFRIGGDNNLSVALKYEQDTRDGDMLKIRQGNQSSKTERNEKLLAEAWQYDNADRSMLNARIEWVKNKRASSGFSIYLDYSLCVTDFSRQSHSAIGLILSF